MERVMKMKDKVEKYFKERHSIGPNTVDPKSLVESTKSEVILGTKVNLDEKFVANVPEIRANVRKSSNPCFCV
jgi:hypothetical protein